MTTPASVRLRTVEALAWATEALRAAGVQEPSLEAHLLLAQGTGQERAMLLAHPERSLTAHEAAAFRELVEGRVRRVPLAYLVGWREFYGRRFLVGPDVLVPRPETEQLVELALQSLAGYPQTARPLVLDVGTGSGALAVTLALEAPRARVVASDVSFAALRLARENAERLGAQVRLVQADVLAGLGRPVDVLVANVPYVSRAELDAAQPEVREHEPRLALLGGDEGTEVIARLLEQLPAALVAGGTALIEIGWRQGSAVAERATRALPMADVAVLRDAAGLDRVLRVRRG